MMNFTREANVYIAMGLWQKSACPVSPAVAPTGVEMTPTSTGRDSEPAMADHYRWLDKVAILSEKVGGRWRHQVVTGGPAWEAYMASVETRTTAS